MSRFRFTHIFTLLMLLSALSAFVIPARYTDPARAPVLGLFAPVSKPVRVLASALHRRISPETKVDEGTKPGQRRSDNDLLAENQLLRIELANLGKQLELLKELNADRSSYGDIRPLCTPFSVMGSDAGERDSLILSGLAAQSLRTGQAVLHSGGSIAGKVDRVGVTGAMVRLVSDRDFRVQGAFGTFRRTPNGAVEFVRFANLHPLLIGKGRGRMIADKITLRQAEDSGLKPNDWVVLDDPDWPDQLQQRRIGRVTGIAPLKAAPLFAEIIVEPGTNLELLREVMVMSKN